MKETTTQKMMRKLNRVKKHEVKYMQGNKVKGKNKKLNLEKYKNVKLD